MRTYRTQPTLIALALSSLFTPALAQTVEPATLAPIVITETRVPSLLSGQSLFGENFDAARSVTGDTATLLRDIPGVQTYGAGGVSSLPVIRGLADDRLRIQVDGMDLISSCANHMNPALSYIDPSQVDKVEVFAGVTPVSVGGDSVGGTIRVNSRGPRFSKAGEGLTTSGQLGSFYRSNGDAWGANVAVDAATETFFIAYTGSTVESGNYKSAKDFKAGVQATNTTVGSHWIPGNEVGSSSYKSQNQAIAFGFRHENHVVDLKVGFQNIPYQGFANQRMDMTDNDSTQINLRYQGKYQWGNLEARVYNEHTRHKMNFAEDKQFWYQNGAPGMPMETEGKTTGVLVKGDIVLTERDILRLGGEFQRYRLNDWWPVSGTGGMWPDVFQNINNGQRDRLSAFAEWEASWSKQWMTLLGLRSDNVRSDSGSVSGYNGNYVTEATAFNARDRQRTDHNLDLTTLTRYTPRETESYEIGYAQKTRSPNLYERYAWSTGGMAMRMINFTGDGNGYIGNLDLKPEVAHTISATADWHGALAGQWGLKVTPYATYVQDYIDAARCTTTGFVGTSGCSVANGSGSNKFVYLRYVNQSARLYGLDVSGFMPLAQATGMGSFKLTGALNYTRGKNQTTGDNLYNIMPLNAKLALEHRLGSWSNAIESQFVSAKDNVSQERNEIKTAGYSLLNLRTSYEWKTVRLDFGIDNALNKMYFHPLGGAYVGQGATMFATSAPWGVGVPGMARSAYVGMNMKF